MLEKTYVKPMSDPIKAEQDCFEQLTNGNKSKIFSYIRHYIRDVALAEDILHDTYLKVFQSFKTGMYSDKGTFIPWVQRIAHNLIIDHFRKLKQMNTISNDNYESDLFNSKIFANDNIEDDIIKREIHLDIRKMINKLPDEQKEVIIMKHYADLSFREIADLTNVSINTALGRMRYALINLRKLMGDNRLSLVVN